MHSIKCSFTDVGLELTFNPLEDITTYELSQCMAIIMGLQLGAYSILHAEKLIISQAIERHFNTEEKK